MPGDARAKAQVTIALALARDASISDDKITARVIKEVPDVPIERIQDWISLFRGLRGKFVKAAPRMLRGASGQLDFIKQARFEFDLVSEFSDLDRDALSTLIGWTYYYDSR